MRRLGTIGVLALLALACLFVTGWADALLHLEEFEGGVVGDWYSYDSELTHIESAGNGFLRITDPPAGAWSGAYTRLGAYRSSFSGGWSSSLDLYVDVSDPRVAAGTYGFDVSQAMYDKDGNHEQDNIFHVGAADLDSDSVNSIYINASHNTDYALNTYKLAANQPYGSTEDPGEITESGWYTFEYVFSPSVERPDFVEVCFKVKDAAGSVIWTADWTTEGVRLDEAGGNGYIWFTYADATALDVDHVRYGYPTVQAAADAATPGDTILVENGDYVEQVFVNKDVALQGQAGASVKSPGSTLVTIDESSYTFDPIIFLFGGTMDGSNHVSGTDVIQADVKDLDIDGQNLASNGSRFVGILLRNVEGEISGNTLHDLYDSDGEGDGPETFGILVYGDSDVEILNNDISEFSRGGIGVSGGTALIQGNTVAGNGLEPLAPGSDRSGWWAENGIQLGHGASGQIIDNVVSGCRVNNPDWGSTAILVYSAAPGIDVLGNTVLDSDMGIYMDSLGGTVDGNRIDGSDWGLLLYDSEIAVENNDALNSYVGVYLLSGETLGSFRKNVVQDNEYGVYLAGEAPAPVRYNAISGNTYGLWATAGQADAALNWWGSADGPTVASHPQGDGDTIYGDVIFSPWLGMNPDGDPSTPGVQLVSPMLFVVDDVGPEPTDGYLGTAIIASNDLTGTDGIEVRGGSFDASETITDGVELYSAGGADETTLTGAIQIDAPDVLLGGFRQGFSINGPITVGVGIDAETIHINWNDIFDVVTNNGEGLLDATFNYWGEDGPDTVGLVNTAPVLPESSETIIGYMDLYVLSAAEAISFSHGLLGGLNGGQSLLALRLMNEFAGLGLGDAIDLIEEYGRASISQALTQSGGDWDRFSSLLIGYGVGGGGGAGMYLGGGAGGGLVNEDGIPVFTAGDPVPLQIELYHPVSGDVVTDAFVTFSVSKPMDDGTPMFVGMGVMTFDADLGAYVFEYDSTGLESGIYDIYIATGGDYWEHMQIEIE